MPASTPIATDTHTRITNTPQRRVWQAGFTLAEVLVVVAILGILAAVAIPTLIQQRGNIAESTTRSALQAILSDIDERLAAEGDTPTGGQWNICHSSSTYPTNPSPLNTCLAGDWQTTLASTGVPLSPALSGEVADNIYVQGVVAANGTYCVQAIAEEDGASVYSVTDTDPDPVNQTCSARGWSAPTGILGQEANTASSSLPAAPTSVTASSPTPDTVEVSWDVQPNTTYQVSLTGMPVQTYTTGSVAGTSTCSFPADTCDGEATGTLNPGNYTATVRALGSNGWSPATTIDFTHPVE